MFCVKEGKLMNNQHKPYGPYEKYFRRVLDVFCGLAALLVFWWLYIIVAVLVRIKLGSPVLFKQERPGKNEEIFRQKRPGTAHRHPSGKDAPQFWQFIQRC